MMQDLKKLNILLNNKDIDEKYFNSLDSFKLEIIKNVVDSFISHSSLESIHFDFNDILRIASVWEGSNEPFITLIYIKQEHISFDEKDINEKFYFMTEEPSFLTELLKEFKTNNKPDSYVFSKRNSSIISEINDFLGPKINSYLSHLYLSQTIALTNNITTAKLKI